MQPLATLGFWFNPLAPNAYPLPQLLVARSTPARRAPIVKYLRGGRVLHAYRGYSSCRFQCGIAVEQMGHRDLTDGTWVWPEGLAHYIDVHGVRLPDDFLAHALGKPARPSCEGRLLDDGPWLTWARAQGACLDRGPWRVPERSALAAKRARAHPQWQASHPVLWREDNGDILCVGVADHDYMILEGTGGVSFGRWTDWPRSK